MNRRFLTLVLLLLCFVSLPAGAQIDKGSIEAVALDQTQSPLPGVTVTVTRPDTGYENVGVTNTVGLARFPFLPPATTGSHSRSKGSRRRRRTSCSASARTRA